MSADKTQRLQALLTRVQERREQPRQSAPTTDLRAAPRSAEAAMPPPPSDPSGFAPRPASQPPRSATPSEFDAPTARYKAPAPAKQEPAKVEVPKVEAPKVEAPKVEAPKVEAPKAAPAQPKAPAAKVETPKAPLSPTPLVASAPAETSSPVAKTSGAVPAPANFGELIDQTLSLRLP